MRFEKKSGFTLPFNENNPLNYVKPITVNIYFKQQNPGIGVYNPEKVQKSIPAAQSVFKSLVERNFRKLQDEIPAPNSYEVRGVFDLKEREKDAGSRPFKMAVPMKIVPVNLYNPHA